MTTEVALAALLQAIGRMEAKQHVLALWRSTTMAPRGVSPRAAAQGEFGAASRGPRGVSPRAAAQGWIAVIGVPTNMFYNLDDMVAEFTCLLGIAVASLSFWSVS